MTTRVTRDNVTPASLTSVDLHPSFSAGLSEHNSFNIALLGFKMAVNDGLTVFNLVDGVVDEFHDESGTDEAEGSNDTYCATSDLYQNITFSPLSNFLKITSLDDP